MFVRGKVNRPLGMKPGIAGVVNVISLVAVTELSMLPASLMVSDDPLGIGVEVPIGPPANAGGMGRCTAGDAAGLGVCPPRDIGDDALCGGPASNRLLSLADLPGAEWPPTSPPMPCMLGCKVRIIWSSLLSLLALSSYLS